MDEWQIDVDKLSESTKRYESHTELLETLLAEASDYENNIAVRLPVALLHRLLEITLTSNVFSES